MMKTKSKKRKLCGLGGSYTWNADSTLASYPGPGYTRKLSYDEEGWLTKIDRDNGTTITPVFEYGYGFDGNRRWRKDLAGNTWDWYPCGVACCAGELVTMRSTNGGSSWTSNVSNLPIIDGTFANGITKLNSLSGQGVTTTTSAVSTTTSYDLMGVERIGLESRAFLNADRASDERMVLAGGTAQLTGVSANAMYGASSAEKMLCDARYAACKLVAMTAFAACLAAVVKWSANGAKFCNLIPIPNLRVACLVALAASVAAAVLGCGVILAGGLATCYHDYRGCLDNIKPKPKPGPKPKPIEASMAASV